MGGASGGPSALPPSCPPSVPSKLDAKDICFVAACYVLASAPTLPPHSKNPGAAHVDQAEHTV